MGLVLDFDNLDTYLLILETCNPFQVDPSGPIESEHFFRNLLSQYKDWLMGSWVKRVKTG